MSHYFRAVAIDYDGTLTTSDAPAADVLAAIAEVRESGRRVVLVTGRILQALRAVFPAADSTFDAIVAENGAVVWMPAGGARAVAPGVPVELATALERRGVPLERGEVILATDVTESAATAEEIARLGLEAQLVRNRHALMIVPAGVSKGTGLLEALATLGLSHHSTIGVGDAENDHSLLDVCELGAAVANAVPGLQAHADVVLGEADGAGVIELLRGALLRGDVRVQPRRWQVRLGVQPDGTPVYIPGSQVNVLVTGGPVSGKSCLAGLLTERLVAMHYSVCVLDPEGDHIGLGALRGILTTGGTDRPPDMPQLGRLLRHRFGSVVVDLSLQPERDRIAYCRAALTELGQLRVQTGLPHWIIFDEAHLVPDATEILSAAEGSPTSGVCLVTYDPARLAPNAIAAMDFTATIAAGGALPRNAVLSSGRTTVPFTIDRRTSEHVRHWHKYTSAELPPHRRFYFRRDGALTGAVAANMREFHQQMSRCEPAVIRHHTRNRDFSRWVDDVVQDRLLADRLRHIETTDGNGQDTEQVRRELLHAVESRYAEE